MAFAYDRKKNIQFDIRNIRCEVFLFTQNTSINLTFALSFQLYIQMNVRSREHWVNKTKNNKNQIEKTVCPTVFWIPPMNLVCFVNVVSIHSKFVYFSLSLYGRQTIKLFLWIFNITFYIWFIHLLYTHG